VLWNGNGGSVVFFQNEMPYDVPSQAAWQANPHTQGYPAFLVSDRVRTFAGYGMGSYSFFNQGIDVYAANAFQVPISYPMANPALPPGTQNVYIFPQHPKDPVSPNWLFDVQQQFGPNTVFTLRYTGNQDHHMQAGVDFAAVNLNPGDYQFQTRKIDGFANEYFLGDILNSSYNALQVQLRHHSGNLNLEANYAWSHEIDITTYDLAQVSNPFNIKYDKGSGALDRRQMLLQAALI